MPLAHYYLLTNLLTLHYHCIPSPLMGSRRTPPTPPVRADVREGLLDVGLESAVIEGGHERERVARGILESQRRLQKRTVGKPRRGAAPVDQDAVPEITVIVIIAVKCHDSVRKRAAMKLQGTPPVREGHQSDSESVSVGLP